MRRQGAARHGLKSPVKTANEPSLAAREDASFSAGGDSVRYLLELGDAQGPFTVNAELNYQTIGVRWAEHLKAYESFETQRFVSYYEDTAEHSIVRLAAATRRDPAP